MHRRSIPLRHLLVVAAVPLLMLPACGGDGGATVDITLREFSVGASSASVESGEVTFDATNEGPDDVHELVVVRITGDADITSLPTGENGEVDEAGAGIEVVDEIEEFPVGESASMTVELEAGSYALICNVVQEEPDGTIEAHFAEGMRTPFTVT